MKTEKYGFIYLWFDKKYQRFYLGRHWGSEDDGYICSSRMMRQSYNRRPRDFKRRIIKRVSTKEELIIQEQRYLDMIKPEETGSKYYNISLKATTPTMKGRKHSPETRLKMSLATKGQKMSEETREKLRQANLGKTLSEKTKKKISENHNRDYTDLGFRKKMSDLGKNRSEETRKKISENNQRLIAEGKIGTKGKKFSEESKARMRQAQQNNKALSKKYLLLTPDGL